MEHLTHRKRFSGGQDDWILIDEGSMAGINILVDHETDEVVSISSRYTRDSDRWKGMMPSLAPYSKSLLHLDLDNSRYLIELSDSIGSLLLLQKLYLTRCSRLERLPVTLCNLSNLQDVSFDCYVSLLRIFVIRNLTKSYEMF